MKNSYDYYASQCGLGPYPVIPTNDRVSVIGNQFGSLDRGMTVISKYQKEKDAYRYSTDSSISSRSFTELC